MTAPFRSVMRAALCALLSCSAARSVRGESDAKAQDLLRKLREVRVYSCRVQVRLSLGGEPTEVPSRLWVKGDRFRLQLKPPPLDVEQIIVSDGETTHTWMPGAPIVQRIDLRRLRETLGPEAATAMGIPGAGGTDQMLQGMDLETFRHVGRETLDGEELDVIEGAAQPPPEAVRAMGVPVPVKGRYWLSPADGLPRRIAIYADGDREIVRQEFTEVNVKDAPDDALFVFEMPEGAQAFDLTDQLIQTFRAMNDAAPAPAAP